jgi:hypothetical protein
MQRGNALGTRYYNSYIRIANEKDRAPAHGITLQRFDFLPDAVVYSARKVVVAGKPSSSRIFTWHDDAVLATDAGTSYVLDATSLQLLGTHMHGIGAMPRIDPVTNRLMSVSKCVNRHGQSTIVLCEHLADDAMYILHTIMVDPRVQVDDFGFTRSRWIVITNDGGNRVRCIVANRTSGQHCTYFLMDDGESTPCRDSRVMHAWDTHEGYAKFMFRTMRNDLPVHVFADIKRGCMYHVERPVHETTPHDAHAIDVAVSRNGGPPTAVYAPYMHAHDGSSGFCKLAIQRDSIWVDQAFAREGWAFSCDEEPMLAGDHVVAICHDIEASRSNMLIFRTSDLAGPASTFYFESQIPAGGRGAWVRTQLQ